MTSPLLIRESSRVRRARIVVAPHRPVEVVVPPGTSAAWIDGFVAEHREWIERRRAAEPEPSLGLQREGVAWLGGEPQPVPAGDLAGWYRRPAPAMLTEGGGGGTPSRSPRATGQAGTGGRPGRC